MAIKTKIRMTAITGSVPTDTEGAAAAGDLTILDLSGTLAHMASAIKRIHGASSFSEAAAGIFKHNLVPDADDTYDLGTSSAAWQDLHMEGDVLMTDAGKIETAAGDMTVSSAAAAVAIDAATAIILDSDSGDIEFSDGTVPQLALDMDGTAGAQILQVKVAGDDLVFKTQGGTEAFRMESNGDIDLAGGLGSSGVTVTAAGALSADGRIVTDDSTNATSTTDGSIQTDGGLSVVLDAVIGDDLFLKSDSAELVFGAGDDVKLVHTNDTGLHLNAGMRLGFRDQGGEYVHSVEDGILGIVAATEIDLTATDIDINGAVDISGNLVVNGNLDINGSTTTIDTTNLSVEDSIIALGVSGSSGGYSTTGHRGILFPRGEAGSSVAGLWFDGSRFQLGVSATGPLSASFGAASAYSKLMVERVEFDNANNYIELDTDVKIISAADVVIDPAGGELLLDGNFVSAADSSDDLGASGVAWNKLWVDEIDLNGQGDISMGGTGRIDLNASDNVSIRASSDTVMTFEAAGADKIDIVSTGIEPSADDGAALGSANKNWSDLYLADAAVLNFGDDQDVTLTHVVDAGILLSSTDQLQFGDSGTYVHQVADGVLKLVSDNIVDLSVGAGGVQITGTTPLLTIGDAGAEDTFLVFDGNAQDYRIGLDDGTDKLEFGVGAAHGSTIAFTIDSSNVADFTTAKLSYGGTVIASTAAEINLLDGDVAVGSSITLADTDGFIVDDAGTTKKIPASDFLAYLAPAKFVATRTATLAAGTDLDTSLANVEAADEKLVEVYVNGMLMQRGANDGANMDWYPGSSSGNIKFEFALEVDDVVQVILRKV